MGLNIGGFEGVLEVDLGFWADNGVLARSNAQVRGEKGVKVDKNAQKCAKMNSF